MAPHEITPVAWLLLAVSMILALAALLLPYLFPAERTNPQPEPPTLNTRGPDDTNP